MTHPPRRRASPPGFTLIELLVVVAILAVLAALVFSVSSRAILSAERTRCVALIREFEVPMAAYQTDHLRPILPEEKEDDDTIYGDPNGFYSTAPIVGVLTGAEDMQFEETNGQFYDLTYLNPRRTVYLDPQDITRDGEGLREDGKIYDPWGRELIFAVNSRVRRQDENQGFQDEILYTYTLGEYADSVPGYREFAIWSYGKDMVIGNEGGPMKDGLPVFAGSDDVKSW